MAAGHRNALAVMGDGRTGVTRATAARGRQRPGARFSSSGSRRSAVPDMRPSGWWSVVRMTRRGPPSLRPSKARQAWRSRDCLRPAEMLPKHIRRPWRFRVRRRAVRQRCRAGGQSRSYLLLGSGVASKDCREGPAHDQGRGSRRRSDRELHRQLSGQCAAQGQRSAVGRLAKRTAARRPIGTAAMAT